MEVLSEKCKCKSKHPIVLQHQLTENSIVCSNCNLCREIALSDKLNKGIIEWNQDYNKAYKDWLQLENKFEELTSPSSNLNSKGLNITAKLNTIIPAYYWLHVDEGLNFSNCPKCEGKLTVVENEYTGNHQICDKCKLLTNN